jgi:hypothetical protein
VANQVIGIELAANICYALRVTRMDILLKNAILLIHARNATRLVTVKDTVQPISVLHHPSHSVQLNSSLTTQLTIILLGYVQA